MKFVSFQKHVTTLGVRAAFCCLALLPGWVQAQDWPEWGGTPARNMYSPAKGLPVSFARTTPMMGLVGPATISTVALSSLLP